MLAANGTVLGEALLVPGRFVIGRTPDNDLQIDNRFVSRHHAQIVTTEDGSWIEDLNSTNGIFVRGKRVRRCKLQIGDIAMIGTHELRYSRVTPETTGSLPPTQPEKPAVAVPGRDSVKQSTVTEDGDADDEED